MSTNESLGWAMDHLHVYLLYRDDRRFRNQDIVTFRQDNTTNRTQKYNSICKETGNEQVNGKVIKKARTIYGDHSG